MKKWLIRGGLTGVTVALLLAGTLFCAYRLTVVKSLPLTSGTVYLQGISEPVKIIRDNLGIPHIYAGTEPDLYFAMGYAMTQDRLWQMEFYRRLGQGRLAEVFGADYVDIDRFFRTLTAGSPRKRFPDALQINAEAFAKGINAYLQKPGRVLPLEFRLMRYQPERWQKDDYLAIFKLMAWQLSFGWKVDVMAATIFEKVGAGKFQAAFPDAKAVPFQASDRVLDSYAEPLAGIDHLRRRIEQLTGLMPLPASNAWVVSGRKTVSGKPLLANDTHMGLTNPSMWWEVHLVCPGLDISGFAIPGMPAVAIGHNRHVAWGFTTVMVDDVDFYVEKLNPANDHQYQYKDGWEEFKIVTETIRIRGKSPETLQIRVGRNGPVIDTAGLKDPTRAVTARWAYNERPHPGLAAYLLTRAESIEAVIAALQHWEIPGQNFVFADTDGNIGYWCSAAIPLRKLGDGLLPMPGWTGQYEWQGYVPFRQRPHLINPASGYIANANNKITPSNEPYLISGYWAPGDRIDRIRQMLDSGSKLSIDDMRRMQQDVFCPLAEDIVPELVRVIRQQPASPQLGPIADLLSDWDRQMASASPAASVFEMTCNKLLENIFADEMGPELYARYLDMVVYAPRALRRIFKDGAFEWTDDVTTPEKESLEQIILISVQAAVKELTDLLGRETGQWRWDRLHRLTFTHVMGRRPYLDRIFNLGPFPVAGNHLTVNKLQYDYNAPFAVTDGVSQRMIVDLGNRSNALHVLPTGESGQLASPHYQDQVDLFRNGEYHPVWIQPEQLKEHTEASLKLVPKAD